jgi:hypothetical protein
MRAIGRGSLASGLRILLDVLRIALWVILAVAAALAVLYAAGPADIDRLDPWYMTTFDFALTIAALIAALLVVGRLRRIFATLSAGDPFVPENADHLRIIAIVISVFEAARLIATGVRSSLLSGAGGESEIAIQINLLVWFAALSLFVLSEVFREGARLRADQQLTI